MPKGKAFTFDEQAEFVRLWQTASDAGEVGRAVGEMDTDNVGQRAFQLRRRGVPLKVFKRPAAASSRGRLTDDQYQQLAMIARKWAPKEAV